MSKTFYQLMSAIVLFALIFGNYSSAGASSQMAAATYYVSTTGNDANAGTQSAPFKTITKAISASANGDQITVTSGNYPPFTFSNRIIECIPARTCIISNSNGGAITLQGNATLRGFLIDGFTTYAAVNITGNNNLAENNEVKNGYQCSVGHVAGDGTCPSYADTDAFRFWGTNNIMRRNYIHDLSYDNPRNATAKPPHIDCFQTWDNGSIATDAIIEYNICDNFSIMPGFGTQGIELEDAVRTIIRHNYFHTYGKKVDIGGINIHAADTMITNNIFVGGLYLYNLPQYGVFNGGPTTLVRNNLFYDFNGGSTPLIYNVPTANQSGNIPTGAGGSRSSIVWVDPLLDTNLHPLSGSPLCLTNGEFIGVFPCSAAAPTVAPTLSPTPTPVNTITATVTPVVTASVIYVSPTPTTSIINIAFLLASPTPTSLFVPASATPTTSLIPATATPTASAVPASPTTAPPSVSASATPTASSIPASPTSTASPIPVLPTASATPTASSTPVPPSPTSTTAPPTAVIQEKIQTISGTIYDDKDKGFSYSSGDWKDVPRTQAYGGSFKKTAEKGAFVTFTFTGESFSVLYTSGPAMRKINVYIDGLLVGTINENGNTSVYQKRWDFPGKLTLGSHKLKLVFVTGSTTNKTVGSVDAVIIR